MGTPKESEPYKMMVAAHSPSRGVTIDTMDGGTLTVHPRTLDNAPIRTLRLVSQVQALGETNDDKAVGLILDLIERLLPPDEADQVMDSVAVKDLEIVVTALLGGDLPS